MIHIYRRNKCAYRSTSMFSNYLAKAELLKKVEGGLKNKHNCHIKKMCRAVIQKKRPDASNE